MASAGRHWDATEVLNIGDLFTCVSYAPSKRRKCRNRIAEANRERASIILLQVENMDVTTTVIRDKLERLALCILCKGAHQSEAATMVSEWLYSVERFKAGRMSQRSQPPVFTGILSLLPTTPLQSDVDAIWTWPSRPHRTAVASAVRSALRPAGLLPSPPSTPTRHQPRRPSSTNVRSSSQSTSRNPTPPMAPIPLNATPRTSEPAEESQPPLRPAQPAASPPPSPQANPPPAPHNHNTKECSICYEPVSRRTGISSHCKHLLHPTCINTWFNAPHASLFPKARECPYCRRPWNTTAAESRPSAVSA